MKLVNLTPHAIRIIGAFRCDSMTVVPPDGMVARVTHRDLFEGFFEVGDSLVPTYHTIFGTVDGLPDEVEGTVYIVSALVAKAIPGRRDLYSPAGLIRDENGNVIGCRGLCR